ncbi:MAG: protein kinase domain-containing protein, partial [Planctomycetota bacterium]
MPDPGSIIGHYEVLGELGRGGMGIVYRARDPRLDRDVAIKALPEEVSSDPARLERFEREGRALAQLNHPNVAGIHGVEEHDGRKYLVLEYVEGETLGDRLEPGPLSVEEALELAIGIAAGLEAAHDVGIIHRDLKPDNIKITPEGAVKVLDFGLAKSSEVGSSAEIVDAATRTTPRSPTIPGAILGTAAYMSPEQARGRHVDKRTDIWSFGVVLYEMLTGTSPFVGETANDSIGAVLHKGVDLERLDAATPSTVRRVLERCIERDKALRYRDIGDIRIELLRAMHEQEHEGKPTTSSRGLTIAFATMCIIAVGTGVGWYLAATGAEPRERPVRKFDLMRGTPENPINAERARIAPDGARIAFVRDDLVHVRDLGAFESRPVPGTEGASSVFWSPDSNWIGYTTTDAIYKVALSGGGAIKIADAKANIDWDLGTGWTSDGRIIYREQ